MVPQSMTHTAFGDDMVDNRRLLPRSEGLVLSRKGGCAHGGKNGLAEEPKEEEPNLHGLIHDNGSASSPAAFSKLEMQASSGDSDRLTMTQESETSFPSAPGKLVATVLLPRSETSWSGSMRRPILLPALSPKFTSAFCHLSLHQENPTTSVGRGAAGDGGLAVTSSPLLQLHPHHCCSYILTTVAVTSSPLLQHSDPLLNSSKSQEWARLPCKSNPDLEGSLPSSPVESNNPFKYGSRYGLDAVDSHDQVPVDSHDQLPVDSHDQLPIDSHHQVHADGHHRSGAARPVAESSILEEPETPAMMTSCDSPISSSLSEGASHLHSAHYHTPVVKTATIKGPADLRERTTDNEISLFVYPVASPVGEDVIDDLNRGFDSEMEDDQENCEEERKLPEYEDDDELISTASDGIVIKILVSYMQVATVIRYIQVTKTKSSSGLLSVLDEISGGASNAVAGTSSQRDDMMNDKFSRPPEVTKKYTNFTVK